MRSSPLIFPNFEIKDATKAVAKRSSRLGMVSKMFNALTGVSRMNANSNSRQILGSEVAVDILEELSRIEESLDNISILIKEKKSQSTGLSFIRSDKQRSPFLPENKHEAISNLFLVYRF